MCMDVGKTARRIAAHVHLGDVHAAGTGSDTGRGSGRGGVSAVDGSLACADVLAFHDAMGGAGSGSGTAGVTGTGSGTDSSETEPLPVAVASVAPPVRRPLPLPGDDLESLAEMKVWCEPVLLEAWTVLVRVFTPSILRLVQQTGDLAFGEWLNNEC